MNYLLDRTRYYDRAKLAGTMDKCLYWLDRYYTDNGVIAPERVEKRIVSTRRKKKKRKRKDARRARIVNWRAR